jgi:tetratricopeptide (TPR) repeat protein
VGTFETRESEFQNGLGYRFGYTFGEAARIVGLSAGRIRYWQRTELLPASGHADADRLGFRDLVGIRAVLALLERGVPLRRIRHSVQRIREKIPELERPLDALRLGGEGAARIVFRHRGQLIDPEGQLVLELDDARGTAGSPVSLVEHVADPADPAAALGAFDWFERGCHLDALPRSRAEAEDAYRRALDCDPCFADAHCNLGALQQQDGRRDEALASYEAALLHEPAHLEARFNVAGLLEEGGRDEASLTHYKRLLEFDPAHAEAHLNVALLYEKLGLPRRGRAHWRRYVGLRPRGNWAEVARQRLREAGAEEDVCPSGR